MIGPPRGALIGAAGTIASLGRDAPKRLSRQRAELSVAFPTREAGFAGTDNLNPQKARILLACALIQTQDRVEIARMIASY